MENRAGGQQIVEVAIVCADEGRSTADRAAALSTELGIPLEPGPIPSDRVPAYRLVVSAQGLEIRETARRGRSRVCVDFAGGSTGHRIRSARGSKGPLATAIGVSHAPFHVVDATAGLGRDAFMLAVLGCDVTAMERSPILAALLRDGLERAAGGSPALRSAARRVSLRLGDARSLLLEMEPGMTPDVVYLDPMYPPRTSQALPKKELQFCRALVGDDRDAEALLLVARQVARRRVVVKRPRHAPPLGPGNHSQIRTKMVRYDVYRP